MEAIILLPAHELLPLGRIKRVINNTDKNVAFAQGADGNPARKVAIVVGAIDERHKNRGNLLSKLDCSALALVCRSMSRKREPLVRIGKALTAKGFRSFHNDPQLLIACVGCVLQRMLRQSL